MKIPIFDNQYVDIFSDSFAISMIPGGLAAGNVVIPIIPKVKKEARPGEPEDGGDLVGIPTDVPVAPEIPVLEPIVVTPNPGRSWAEWGYEMLVRAGGAAQAIGGVAEVVLGGVGVKTGIVGTPATGGLSLFLSGGGVILVGHGIDNFWAGAKTAIYGNVTQTMTSSMVEAATGSYVAGEIVDAGVGIALTLGVSSGIKTVQTAIQTASKNVAGAAKIENIVTQSGKHISDDAFVHFGHEAYDAIKLSKSNKSYWFRYGDIKRLTPEQVRGAIGDLARSGLPGGTRFMHIYNTAKLKKVPPTSGHGIPEFISTKVRTVTDSLQLF